MTAALLYRRYHAEAGIAVTLLFAFVVGSVAVELSRSFWLFAVSESEGMAI